MRNQKQLVGGKFLAGSFKAKIWTVLSDRKPHPRAEIENAVEGCANVGDRIKTSR